MEQLAFNERMAELGRLSAALLHELNTPLSVIVSAAQMTLREDDLSDFVREMISRIDTEAQRLSQLSRGMLCFSRRDNSSEENVDLVKVLQEVMQFLRYEAQKLSVTVIEEFDYDLPPAGTSGNRIKQVVINLVMNAAEVKKETESNKIAGAAVFNAPIRIPASAEPSVVAMMKPDWDRLLARIS